MQALIYKIKRIFNWILAGDFKVIYSMMMRYNKFAYYELDDNAGYQKWWKRHDKKSFEDTAQKKPLISILLVASNGNAALTIKSVMQQTYGNWQLLIATDVNINIADSRINIHPVDSLRDEGFVLNNLLALTAGEYLMVLKAGDQLPKSALSLYTNAINNNPDCKLVYGDEDRINHENEHSSPFFKPSFSRNLLYSLDYISRGSIFKTSDVKRCDGFNSDLDGCYVYDLALKFIKDIKNEDVCHIPRIIYHCRADGVLDESVMISQIAQHYVEAKVVPFEIDNERVFCKIVPELSLKPLVSIIIPTKDKMHLLTACIESIESKTTYANYEVIVVDNGSSEPEALTYLKSLEQKGVKVLEYNKPYNYSAINNYAVEFAKGEILCLLNNDIEVISDGWLEELVWWALRPSVGAVGAKLYYPSNNIQHAGMHCVRNPYTANLYMTHCYINQSKDLKGYLNSLHLVHEVSSVTGACLVMKKDLFLAVGGFDAENTPTSYSDVDLCFKIRGSGYGVLWNPAAELYHHESASRGLDIERSKAAYLYMVEKWPEYFKADVSINSNLSLHYTRYPVLVKW